MICLGLLIPGAAGSVVQLEGELQAAGLLKIFEMQLSFMVERHALRAAYEYVRDQKVKPMLTQAETDFEEAERNAKEAKTDLENIKQRVAEECDVLINSFSVKWGSATSRVADANQVER